MSDAEVDEAVDALMSTLGVPDDGRSEIETGFEAGEDKPKLDGGGEKAGVAPSADLGALWGAPKPKKK